MERNLDADAGGEDRYVLDQQVGYLLRLATQRHTTIFQHNTILDLTPTQFSAMVRLAAIGECSQNELGRRTAMDVATIKGVVDRLRSKGLVTLAPDPNDKRRSLISISDDYKAIGPDLHAIGRAITQETLAPLSEEEKSTFVQLLKKIS